MNSQPDSKQRLWEVLSQLYHDALARDASERAAFLAEACGGDAALRREVESLLEYGPKLPKPTPTPGRSMRVWKKKFRNTTAVSDPVGTALARNPGGRSA